MNREIVVLYIPFRYNLVIPIQSWIRTYKDTSHIYLYFKSIMKKEMMDPIGYPDICRFRLLDMYSACTTEDVKKWILDSKW